MIKVHVLNTGQNIVRNILAAHAGYEKKIVSLVQHEMILNVAIVHDWGFVIFL
jgi:hypothetical protein